MQNSKMNSTANLLRQNLRLVKQLYPGLRQQDLSALRALTQDLHLSVSRFEILCIDGKWYVTHAGLLRIALRQRCLGIRTVLQDQVCDATARRWVFKATVYKSPRSKGFVGYGDADPSNVSPLVRGAELRVAETRAVNRALRKAYGIGLCSVEELKSFSAPSDLNPRTRKASADDVKVVPSNGQPRLRDRLCLLIRHHRLDPTLVKCYATEFCGTESLRDANREQLEAFVNHLAEWAVRDREGLVCHLNRYARPPEVKS